MARSSFLHPSEKQAKAYFSRPPEGPVIMLNLLKYRPAADYSGLAEIAPPSPISGKEAYDLYMTFTLPLLEKAGSEVIFYGSARPFIIGPEDEDWDAALLVRHASAASFMAFAADPAYLKTSGHRTAALADSRLLPIEEQALKS